ncbi:UDP-N-acetyl-D-glucosamine dehydrogenase [Desulfonatronum thiosulfatophilum]|uniref:UDP-N-acetyl-D-glucosamine dehydrogenase n=1 Tax=Desulfonatronum thiosulfatophilum TaxID=617002 RepID=A0A1G6ER04_9BACT|nr:nucleotide sugar dehydrogenase [Desulfonatronum thiosulfatophilum]SDB59830.1 UDP-N-acetyl-D-glucosamine dehydrogenase [Desulfonatronum thiosulfatophilum]
MLTQLLEKLNSRNALIGIIGLGYVGLPLALRYLEAGYSVLGLDVDQRKTDMLMAGQSYIKHIPAEPIQQNVQSGKLQACTDFSRAREADALILCVPTPLDSHREPDLSYVISSLEAILPYLRPGQVVSLESTTYPGTTEEELRPRIERGELVVGRDVFLVYSPEREDPGNPDFHTRTIPKICGGSTPACQDAGLALYGQVIDQVIPVSSTHAAEAVKLMENIFRSVNIALVNELKVAFMKMNIDIFEVIRAASTKPFGFMPFYPGPGLGGHCIPIDPFYLTWKAREFDVATRFIELAGEINTSMPYFVVQRAAEVLNDHGKPLKNSRILLLGLAYKAGVDDDRESPTYRIMALLEQKGAVVFYNDPYVPEIRPSREYSRYAGRTSASIHDAYDLIILCTAHDQYRDIDPTSLESPILDTRGFFQDIPGKIHRA